jgi:hypothetical protein
MPTEKSVARPALEADQNELTDAGGQTTEELVRQYLATHHNCRMEEVIEAAAISESRIRRTQAWKDHEEELLDAYLSGHANATTSDVEREFSFSPAKTVGMRAWKSHRERNEAAKPPRKIKERPLTDAVVKARPDTRAADPFEPIDPREGLFRTILEAEDHDTRGRLNGLSTAERNRLLDYILGQCESAEMGAQGSERNLAIVREVTRSWLDDHEQERRRGDWKSRRS